MDVLEWKGPYQPLGILITKQHLYLEKYKVPGRDKLLVCGEVQDDNPEVATYISLGTTAI